MSEFVGGVSVHLEENELGVLKAVVEVVPGSELDREMLMCLAAQSLVDLLNVVVDKELLPNRAARRAASKRRH